MLKLIKIHSKNQIWEYFKNIDIDHDTWIVSKSSERELLSEMLLANKGYFLDQSVQLNRSFFQMLHKQAFPEFSIVSREFAEAYLKRKMLVLKSELAIDVVDERSRLRSISYYAPLLFDLDLRTDLVRNKWQEWLDSSEERKLRLKPDLLLNELFLSFFIDNNMICEDWILPHLQLIPIADSTFFSLRSVSRLPRFYFDLGVDYSMVEATVLQQLAKNYEVIVFQTVHEFDSDYTYLLQAYERFDSLENQSKRIASKTAFMESTSPSIELKKFSSAVAECRFAVGQIRQWHDQGLALQEMAIVAPDISKYLDVLSWQLLAEGIAINQIKKSTFLEFQDIRELLADLSFFKDEIEFSSIRESLMRFHSQDHVGAFNKWEEKLNSQYIQTEQLLRLIDSILPKFFPDHMGMTLNSLLTLKEQEKEAGEFLKCTQIFWEREGLTERKEKIINALYDSTSASIRLSLPEWVEHVERTALQLQASVGIKDNSGLQLTSLNQVSTFNLKNIVVLGLDENGFKSHFKEAISPDDIYNLGSELGIYLAHPDLNVNSYLLEDLISQVQGTVVLSYAYKAIDSSVQNPSQQWQQRAFKQKLFEKTMDVPQPIRWDDLIDNHKSQWLQKRNQKFKLDIQKWDNFPELADHLKNFTLNEISLSPSSVQTFLDCSQKFYFHRVARLKNVEFESFDVSAREKGSWYHTLFEKIILQENEFIVPLITTPLTEGIKKSLLERLQNDFEDILPAGFNPQTWALVKKSYYENVIKFIEHEVSLRQQFPEVKNLKVEWAWETFYDWNAFEFTKVKTDSTVKISGVIDRILLNQKSGQLWLIDYKSSLKNYSSFGAWLEKQEFQLLLYNHIVQYYSSEPWATTVEKLSYWQLPDLNKKKGFVLNDPRFLDFGYSKKDLGSLEEKKKIENEFLEQFKEVIMQMKRGHFYPVPSDEKNCRYCDWRLACRAPHL